MGIVLAATAGFCLWIAMWAVNVKAIDAFIITLLIIIFAVAGRILLQFVPGNRRQ